MDVGLSIFDSLILESEYDATAKELQVIIGVDLLSYSENRYGQREKPTGEKFTQAMREVETMISSIGGNSKVFKSKYRDFKGSLYDKGLTIGFNSDVYYAGFMKFSYKSGNFIFTKGEMGLIIRANASYEYPLIPTVCARFEIEGSCEAGFKLIKRNSVTYDMSGHFDLSVKPSIGVGVNAYIASAYVGFTGRINCNFDLPIIRLENSFEAFLSASFFFEYDVLKWGNRDEWTFAQYKLKQ